VRQKRVQRLKDLAPEGLFFGGGTFF
jgi:hypothetical protein